MENVSWLIYLIRKRIYVNGKISEWEYNIYEKNDLYPKNQDIENQDIGFYDNNKILNNKILNNNNIYTHYENIFCRTLNAIEYQTMTNWLKDKTEEEIIKAIDETAKSNVDNIKYVEKVLYSKRKRNNNPEWFNKTIETEELEPDKDFQDFIKEFRNE